MKYILSVVLVAVSAVCWSQELDCPLTVTSTKQIYAVIYYEHEDPANIGQRYVVSSPLMTVSDVVVPVDIRGSHPVAVDWRAKALDWDGFRSVKTCGEIPSLVYPEIFSHGFENGSTRGWSFVVGE